MSALSKATTRGTAVRIPDLPACFAQAATIDAAISDATLAAREWADDHTSDGFAMPQPRSAGDIRSDKAARFDPISETVVMIFSCFSTSSALSKPTCRSTPDYSRRSTTRPNGVV